MMMKVVPAEVEPNGVVVGTTHHENGGAFAGSRGSGGSSHQLVAKDADAVAQPLKLGELVTG